MLETVSCVYKYVIYIIILAVEYTVDREIFVVKKFSSTTFSDENETFCVTYIDLYQFWSLKSGDEI